MVTCVAFLRAVNLGGRTLRMSDAIKIFEQYGLVSVSAFLASGNITFDSSKQPDSALEDTLSEGLSNFCGFSVPVIIRTEAELSQFLSWWQTTGSHIAYSPTQCVGFTKVVHHPGSAVTLKSLSGGTDSFELVNRDIAWSSTKSQADPTYSIKQLEKRLESDLTFRNVRTIERLVARIESARSTAPSSKERTVE